MKIADYLKSKMFWTGITAIVGSAAGYFTQQMDMVTAITGALAGLAMIFTKSAIVKSGPVK